MALLYILAQNGHHGSEYASHQMNSILPLLVLNKDCLQVKPYTSSSLGFNNKNSQQSQRSENQFSL